MVYWLKLKLGDPPYNGHQTHRPRLKALIISHGPNQPTRLYTNIANIISFVIQFMQRLTIGKHFGPCHIQALKYFKGTLLHALKE